MLRPRGKKIRKSLVIFFIHSPIYLIIWREILVKISTGIFMVQGEFSAVLLVVKKLQRQDDIVFDMINPAIHLNRVSVSQ